MGTLVAEVESLEEEEVIMWEVVVLEVVEEVDFLEDILGELLGEDAVEVDISSVHISWSLLMAHWLLELF